MAINILSFFGVWLVCGGAFLFHFLDNNSIAQIIVLGRCGGPKKGL